MIKPVRRVRALKAQKSRSVVKTLAAPTGGWNARDAIADMPETDAPAMVNFFPQTTDVILRYGSASQGHLGSAAVGNAMLLDGISGYATTPDTAAISVAGDIDLRCYANLDNWTTTSAQFFLSKDASYQFYVINGRLAALIYPTVGTVRAFQSDGTALPVSNGFPLWVRMIVDIDNGASLSVATFYTSSDGSTWTALGAVAYQYSFAAIVNSTAALEIGDGVYPSSVTYQSPPLAVCDSADFDGATNYMTRGALTGAADSKTGIISLWFRRDAAGTARELFSSFTASNSFRVFIGTTSQVGLFSANSGPNTVIDANTVTYPGTTVNGTWWHFLASWDMATTTINIYMNDVSDKVVTTAVNSNVDYTFANWAVGATPSGSLKFDGCIAELYFAPGQYLDFSVTANRRKFISAAGKPVFLGTTGSLPTGTAPIIFQHLDDAEAAANFATNRGTGGNFAITGALATGSTSPSD